MKIIEPSFELSTMFGKLSPYTGERMLRFIEKQARISHRSEERQTPSTWKRFIEANVIGHGDWSVTEHASITATIVADRGVTHELVRHRLFSFTQESTRFVRYDNDLEFLRPAGREANCDDSWFDWETQLSFAEASYHKLLDAGWRPQDARSILPNALSSKIVVTGNLRNWRHFFLMRTSKETHPDFKRITIPMLAEFQKNVPLLYDDIVPGQRQVDNLRMAR
ncbi:MAG: FAD-dependent thymidylate synthase [Candidatus Acidiferrales bacterium]